MLNEEGPSIHVDLEKEDSYQSCNDDITELLKAGTAREREHLADQAVSFSGTSLFCKARDSPAPRSIFSTWHIPLQPQLLPTVH